MTPERQEAIRTALESDDPERYDPERYYAMGGARSLGAIQHDYKVKWELLLALEDEQERRQKLEEALILYGQHDEGCSGSFGPSYPCRCGWREIAAKHHIAERWAVEQPT